jgi:hypothetical protein
MHRSVIPTLIAGSALLAGSLACADDARLRRYEMPDLDTLELTLPPGWVDTVDAPPGGMPTIQLAPAEGPPFEVHVTPESADPDAPSVKDADALREAVRELAERIKPQAVEESIDIRPMEGASGTGFHFSVTDRAPPPDEYRYMTQGALQTGELILWFTILTNDGQQAAVADALSMLQSAVHRGTGLDQR